MVDASIRDAEYDRYSRTTLPKISLHTMFINTPRYSMMTDPELVKYTSNDPVIEELNCFLTSIKTCLEPHTCIPMQILSELHHNGLLQQHLYNETYLVDNVEYITVKNIARRMNLVKSPYKCIVAYIVFKITKDADLEAVYAARPCPQVKTGSDGVSIKKSTMITAPAPIIPTDRPGVFAYYAHARENNPDNTKSGSSSKSVDEPANSNVLETIKKKDEMKSQMDNQMRRTCIVHNWFFEIIDVEMKDEILSIPLCN